MKIKFLKNHGFNLKDSSTEAPDRSAKYLIRMGAAEEQEPEKEEIEPELEKVEIKPKREKKETKGLPKKIKK